MNIFASVDLQYFPVTNLSHKPKYKDKFVYGSWVGQDNFYRALLKYGSFDEYHLFVGTNRDGRILRDRISRLDIALERVKIKSLSELNLSFAKIPYTVLVTTDNIGKLASVRFQYAKKYFPICQIVFSTISYPDEYPRFVSNVLSDLYPFDSIICCSRSVRSVIRNMHSSASSSLKEVTGSWLKYRGRLDCLPCGIQTDVYNRVNKCYARRKLGLPQDKIIILYFGRFSLFDKADLYPLLLAFKKIIATQKNILLVLAGTDAQSKYGQGLKSIAANIGILPHTKFILHNVEDKSLLYSASDIFVSPSDSVQESFGFTVLEAMASGLPTVVSDWNGYKDLVKQGVTGFLIPTYWANSNTDECSLFTIFRDWPKNHLYLAQSVCVDVGKMYEYLLLLVKNKQLRIKLGINARSRALKKYDWNIVLPAYEKLWKALSRISRNYKIRGGKKRPFMLDYATTFNHYPTAILNNQTKIAIGENGLLFLKSKKLPFNIPRELFNTVSLKIIFIILLFLQEVRISTLAEIESYVSGVFKMEPENKIRFQIAWLLKKDLLRLQP